MSRAVSVNKIVACKLLAHAFSYLQLDKSDEQWCGNFLAQQCFGEDQDLSMAYKHLIVFVTVICCSHFGSYLKCFRKCFLEAVVDRNRAEVLEVYQQAGDLLPEIYDNPYLSAEDIIALNEHLEKEARVVKSLMTVIAQDYELNGFDIDTIRRLTQECRNCQSSIYQDPVCAIISNTVYEGPIRIVDYEPLTDDYGIFTFSEDELVYYLATTKINRYTGRQFLHHEQLCEAYRIKIAMTRYFLELCEQSHS